MSNPQDAETNPYEGMLSRFRVAAEKLGLDDGLYYVKESAENFGAEKLFDGAANPAGSEGMARIPDGGLERVIEAAEECPGECIFIEV